MSLILRHVFCRLVFVGLRVVYIRPGFDIQRSTAVKISKASPSDAEPPNSRTLCSSIIAQSRRLEETLGVVNAFAPTRLVRLLLLTARGLCRAVPLELAIPSDFKQKSDTADAATMS